MFTWSKRQRVVDETERAPSLRGGGRRIELGEHGGCARKRSQALGVFFVASLGPGESTRGENLGAGLSFTAAKERASWSALARRSAPPGLDGSVK